MDIIPVTRQYDRNAHRIEQLQKRKQEYKLIGKIQRHNGHTLFSFNTNTKEIKRAEIENKVSVNFHGEPVYSFSVTTEKDCIYLQALNEKNFIKKLKKFGLI